jgi:hypothetical protein
MKKEKKLFHLNSKSSTIGLTEKLPAQTNTCYFGPGYTSQCSDEKLNKIFNIIDKLKSPQKEEVFIRLCLDRKFEIFFH